LKITIIAVGKIKEKFFSDAIQEYVKRLGRYAQVRIVEVADEKTPEQASERQRQQIMEKEAERMKACLFRGNTQKWNQDTYVTALAIAGKETSSVAYAQHLKQLSIQGKSHFVFLIGGSLGMEKTLENMSDEKLSFSPMTFPHQLMRVILLEQLYRSFRIIHGEPYHK
jgi:23S rRNA (pseudouridine1915-N3)-methyltransferase